MGIGHFALLVVFYYYCCLGLPARPNVFVVMLSLESSGPDINQKEVLMKFKMYSNPEGAGWLGWLENSRGTAIGFVRLNGTIIFDW